MKKRKQIIIITLAILAFAAIYTIGLYNCYICTYKTETMVEVPAVVTKHKQDSEDNDWNSYISYEYNNVRYNIFYESETDKSMLTPVDEAVTITVFPTWPSLEAEDFKVNSKAILIALSFLLSAFIAFTAKDKAEFKSCRINEYYFPLSDETIICHLQTRAKKKNIIIVFTLTLFFQFTIHMLAFPKLFNYFWVIASAVLSLLVFFNYALSIIYAIAKNYYIVESTVLYRKIDIIETEDNTKKEKYTVTFKYADKEYKLKVNSTNFYRMEAGDTFHLVLYKKALFKKKPLLGFSKNKKRFVLYF